MRLELSCSAGQQEPVFQSKNFMADYQLAQINISRLLAPLDHPQISDFVAQLAPVNALADISPGFIWRLQSESGNATDLAYNDDPFVIVNMSVWESLESLRAFTYQSHHLQVFRDRSQWFEKSELPMYCLWWVAEGHVPTIAEGRERLEHYQKHGSTPFAFWFSQWFPAPSVEPVLT
jgi:heme-degrading monooxygenase HmoA